MKEPVFAGIRTERYGVRCMLGESLFLLLTESLFLFLQVLGTHSYPPPLSYEEEQALFRTVRNGTAEEAKAARETLICRNLRLVSHIVRKYYCSAQNQEDLISIGTVGLIKAVDTYNYETGTHFATYASRCLQNEILMHFRSQKKFGAEVSVTDTIDTDKEGNPLTYLDIIAEDDTIAEDLDLRLSAAKAVRCIAERLSPRERQILVMRYGLRGGKSYTQRACAEALGISRSYVSRIEKGALHKLRKYLS